MKTAIRFSSLNTAGLTGITISIRKTSHPNEGTGHPNEGTGHPNEGTGHPNGGTGHPNGGTGHPNGGTGHPNGGTGRPDKKCCIKLRQFKPRVGVST